MCYWPVLCCLFLSSSCPSGVLPQVFNRDVPHGIDMCHRPNPFSCVLLRRLSLVVLLHLVIPAASVTDESVSLLQINPTDALVTDHTDDTSVNEAIERLAAQVPIKPPGIVGRATACQNVKWEVDVRVYTVNISDLCVCVSMLASSNI